MHISAHVVSDNTSITYSEYSDSTKEFINKIENIFIKESEHTGFTEIYYSVLESEVTSNFTATYFNKQRIYIIHHN